MVDCPISLADTNVAEDIFVKDKLSLQGNTARSKSNQVQSMYTNVQKDIMERYQSITLSVD